MTTEERLATLEQALAKLRAELARARPAEVRARRFILVDEKGKTRAKLDVTEDGPWLGLYDDNGKTRAVLGMTKDGASLDLGDENGNLRAALVMYKNGPELSLRDENENLRAKLSVDKDGPELSLCDENENLCAKLAIHKEGPKLRLLVKNGKIRAGLGMMKDGPRLDLGDEMRAVIEQRIGEVILIEGRRALDAFAVCMHGAGSEGGEKTCYVKFAVARSGERFGRLLDAIDALALAQGSEVEAGVSLACKDAFQRMRSRGYRVVTMGVAMQTPHGDGFNRAAAYVLSDWR